MYDNNNIFAKILRGEIPCDKLFENDHALAFRDIQPQAPSHILIIPKGQYTSFADFSEKASDAEMLGFMRAISHVAKEEGLEAGGYRLISNHGKNSNQEVPHLHMHLLGGKNLGPLLGPLS